MERSRELTEQRLIDAVGELIEEKGFEKLGVNAVAERAGVAKMLIYRYFTSLDGLIHEYMKKNDFWINTPIEIPPANELKSYLKNLFKQQVAQLRSNTALKRLHRWELTTSNKLVTELRDKRELSGLQRIDLICERSETPKKDIIFIATMINASINYLALLEDNCRTYNGIKIQRDEGWDEIIEGIDKLVDTIILKEDEKQL